MSSDFTFPGGFGPGSQPTEPDAEVFEYLEMPREMATFDLPIAPEPEDTLGMGAGKARLNDLAAALKSYRIGAPATVLDLGDLPPKDLGLVNQILGEGEVSMVAGASIQVQEAVFAGVWRVLHFDGNGQVARDTIEVAAWPEMVRDQAFERAAETAALAEDPTDPVPVVSDMNRRDVLRGSLCGPATGERP